MKKEKNSGCLGYFVHFVFGAVIVILGFSYLMKSNSFTELNNLVKVDLPSMFQSQKQDLNLNENSSSKVEDVSNVSPDYQPLEFNGKKQLVLGELDNLNRATFAHIQLKDSDEPKVKREPRLYYNPVGWHNYNFKYLDDNGMFKKAWLMNRGHLIGYQFSGLNDEPKNLVPQTRFLNAGSMSNNKIESSNPKSMIFYEMKLDKWLENNPSYYLDYMVKPNYVDNGLLPTSVTLYFTGFNDSGTQIQVSLSDSGNVSYNGLVGSVTLDNISPNATINYLDGTAVAKYN